MRDAPTTMRAVVQAASQDLIERESLVELIALAAVAREHVLIIGPPGTGKSAAVRRVANTLGGSYFEYLLGRFTEPSELFGPVDIQALKAGRVEVDVTGMLPEAEFAFLDEVFLGSTAILNTLLTLLNERRFRRGSTSIRCPLRLCVGASNALPDDPALSAFADRFLVRAFVEPLPDAALEDLLLAGGRLGRHEPVVVGRPEHLETLATTADSLDCSRLRPVLAHAVRLLRQNGVALSDRRIVKAQRLCSAAAVLDERESADERDLWPLIYVVPTANGQDMARQVLGDRLEHAVSAILPHAAAAASLNPAARAPRLVQMGQAVLDARPPHGSSEHDAWQLRVEAVLREMDASVPESLRGELLDPTRHSLIQAVGE